MGKYIPLTELPRELLELGLTVSYNKAWQAAIEARFPAEKIGSRWHVHRDDLPLVAAAFTVTGSDR